MSRAHHESTVRRFKTVSVILQTIARSRVTAADEIRRRDSIKGTQAMPGESERNAGGDENLTIMYLMDVCPCNTAYSSPCQCVQGGDGLA